jgi:hypothetical protein
MAAVLCTIQAFCALFYLFLGGGQGLYVCAVNSKWRACYKALQDVSRLPHSSGHVHTSECTSCAAIFASPQRISLALRAGMHFSRDKVMLAAGQHASTDLLRLAHDELARPWSALLAEGALRGSSRRLGRQKLNGFAKCTTARSLITSLRLQLLQAA